MKQVVHYSPYPGMSIRDFHHLMHDGAYQDALASHGKLTRSNIKSELTEDGLVSSWTTTLHRTLDQPHLKPFKVIWPNGLDVRWHEVHTYNGNTGTLKLELIQPKSVHAVIAGVETLTMQGDTLQRRIEIDMGGAKLPLMLGMIPGARSRVGHEIDLGLGRSDERTATWLAEHGNAYKTQPPPAELLDSGREVFEDAPSA